MAAVAERPYTPGRSSFAVAPAPVRVRTRGNVWAPVEDDPYEHAALMDGWRRLAARVVGEAARTALNGTGQERRTAAAWIASGECAGWCLLAGIDAAVVRERVARGDRIPLKLLPVERVPQLERVAARLAEQGIPTGAALRQRRARLGWSQAVAAGAAGIHRRTLLSIEADELLQRPSRLALVAAYDAAEGVR